MSPSDRDLGWVEVDEYFVDTLVPEDAALVQARLSGVRTTMPHAEVAPNQGKLLYLIAQIAGARRILEFGTLAGYSTIWLARAVGPTGSVITLESEATNATVARANFESAGLSDQIEVITGPAAASAASLVASGAGPFDLFFIDADKPSNPEYLRLCLQLARPGSVIVADNVVRAGRVADGAVVDEANPDPRVTGVRSFLEDIAAHPDLDGTAIQTVGSKGWDGFALAVVRGAA